MYRIDRMPGGLIGAALLGIFMLCGVAAQSAAQVPSTSTETDCGPMREITFEGGGSFDYRLRTIDARVNRGVQLIDQYHTDLVRRALQTNQLSRSVMADLDFTLRHSPNHTGALGLLMQFARMGGSPADFPPFSCFFQWAMEFTPNDMGVVQIAAQYYWKAGQISLADDLFNTALKADPNAPELNYNAGLFYFSQKNYARSRELAKVAYAGGFPLPGLRSMLQRQGQWDATPAPKKAE